MTYQPPEQSPIWTAPPTEAASGHRKPGKSPGAKWVILAAVALVVVGLVINLQSVSILSGSATLYEGSVIVAVGVAVAFVGRSAVWLKIGAAVVLVLCIVNTVYTQHQLDDKRAQLSAALAPTPTFSATDTAPPTLASTPAAAEWTTAQAGQKYLALIASANAADAQYNQLGPSPSLKALHSACASVAADEGLLVTGLKTGLWPDAAKSAVSALIPVVEGSEAAIQACGSAPTTSAAITDVNAAPSTTADSNAVRALLGLPASS